ncbi:MAG: arylesterase [Flavimaricola sp.]|nr:arylesterase [Flavimaricola sp.]
MAMGNLALMIVLSASPVQAQTMTLAALGDSLTQGYGLPPEDGFVPQLQAWLTGQGADVSVLNAGVSGDTTAGGLARVGWTLTPDVDAMIVALGGNDFLRGIDPENSKSNLRGILEAAQEAGVEVLLVGITSSNNYGPDYKAAFDGMYQELAVEFGVALHPNFFSGLLDLGEEREALMRFMQGDGIHPNAEGVSLIVEGLGPDVLALLDRAG